jgi:hypothetical protein
MNKTCVLALLLISMAVQAHGQGVCQPEWMLPGSGISPDTTENLPVGYVNQPYTAVAQFKVPKKAPFNGDSIAIDHIVLTNVSGLGEIPASIPFIFQCNPEDCSFKADSVCCVAITGTPSATGIFPLTIEANVFITPVVFIPFPTPGYEIVVYQNVGVPALSTTRFDVSQITPNPFTESSKVYINLLKGTDYSIKVSDLAGNELSGKTFTGKQGVNEAVIDGSHLPSGMYLLTISDGEHSVTRRMNVQK